MVSADKRYDAEVARQSRAEEEQKRQWNIANARAEDVYQREKRAYEATERAPSIIAEVDARIGDRQALAARQNIESRLNPTPIAAASSQTLADFSEKYDSQGNIVEDQAKPYVDKLLSTTAKAEGKNGFMGALTQVAKEFARDKGISLDEASRFLGNKAEAQYLQEVGTRLSQATDTSEERKALGRSTVSQVQASSDYTDALLAAGVPMDKIAGATTLGISKYYNPETSRKIAAENFEMANKLAKTIDQPGFTVGYTESGDPITAPTQSNRNVSYTGAGTKDTSKKTMLLSDKDGWISDSDKADYTDAFLKATANFGDKYDAATLDALYHNPKLQADWKANHGVFTPDSASAIPAFTKYADEALEVKQSRLEEAAAGKHITPAAKNAMEAYEAVTRSSDPLGAYTSKLIADADYKYSTLGPTTSASAPDKSVLTVQQMLDEQNKGFDRAVTSPVIDPISRLNTVTPEGQEAYKAQVQRIMEDPSLTNVERGRAIQALHGNTMSMEQAMAHTPRRIGTPVAALDNSVLAYSYNPAMKKPNEDSATASQAAADVRDIQEKYNSMRRADFSGDRRQTLAELLDKGVEVAKAQGKTITKEDVLGVLQKNELPFSRLEQKDNATLFMGGALGLAAMPILATGGVIGSLGNIALGAALSGTGEYNAIEHAGNAPAEDVVTAALLGGAINAIPGLATARQSRLADIDKKAVEVIGTKAAALGKTLGATEAESARLAEVYKIKGYVPTEKELKEVMDNVAAWKATPASTAAATKSANYAPKLASAEEMLKNAQTAVDKATASIPAIETALTNPNLTVLQKKQLESELADLRKVVASTNLQKLAEDVNRHSAIVAHRGVKAEKELESNIYHLNKAVERLRLPQ